MSNNMSARDLDWKHVRFSMLQLDIDERNEECQKSKKALASRKLLMIAVVFILTAIVMATIAIAVGLTVIEDTRKPIYNSEVTSQPTGSTGKTTSSQAVSRKFFTLVSTTLSRASQPSLMSPTRTFAPEFPSQTGDSHSYIHTSYFKPTTSQLSGTIFHTSERTNNLLEASFQTPVETDFYNMKSLDLSSGFSTAVDFSPTSVTELSSASVQLSSMSVQITTLPPSACNPGEFQCESGQCIPQNKVCDKSPTCLDNSDEKFCQNCQQEGFQCTSGICVWDSRRRCNGIFDCQDISDELSCPPKFGYRRCSNGVQIPQRQWCDGVDNCDDNSDEINCKCVGGRYTCPEGHCIFRQWVCDGHPDCENGTEEVGCSSCSDDQHVCQDYKCINQSGVCDGNLNCTNGDDELHCLHLSEDNSTMPTPLLAEYGGEKFPLCADSWTDVYSRLVCRDLGQTFLSHSYAVAPQNVTQFLKLTKVVKETEWKPPVLQFFKKRAACSSGEIVFLACTHQDCGKRKTNTVTPFIAGGNLVPAGKWPWIVSLSYLGKPQCVGAIINKRWVITAGHCVASPGIFDYTNKSSYFRILMGTTERSQYNLSTAVSIRASSVVHHPKLSSGDFGVLEWDVALIRTAETISFTDYIQPICLPYQNQEFTRNSLCYLAGWGFVNPTQHLTVRHLRDAKMQLWDDSTCSRNTVGGETEVNINSTLCAGYLGLPSGCKGDSGGPLMCQDSPRGHWFLAGVMSGGNSGCGQLSSGNANRFARISAVREWIETTIQNNL